MDPFTNIVTDSEQLPVVNASLQYEETSHITNCEKEVSEKETSEKEVSEEEVPNPVARKLNRGVSVRYCTVRPPSKPPSTIYPTPSSSFETPTTEQYESDDSSTKSFYDDASEDSQTLSSLTSYEETDDSDNSASDEALPASLESSTSPESSKGPVCVPEHRRSSLSFYDDISEGDTEELYQYSSKSLHANSTDSEELYSVDDESHYRSSMTLTDDDEAAENLISKKFRISTNPQKMKAERIEAFFYNRGMGIALGVLFVAANVLVAAHAAFQFTEAGGWTTDNEILRVTVPIARAGGRLVTLNCAFLLLTACKYLWTCIRTYVTPVIPIAFPIDDVMPKYHRYVALTIIFAGCIIHALPQIVNYASKSVPLGNEGWRIWTFGDGIASTQLLLTGTLLTIIFSTFLVTSLKCFRRTAAGFRWFWFFHIGGIATAYPLLLIHGTCRGRPVFLYFAILPLLLYLFDVFIRRFNISTANIIRWKTHKDKGQEITELIVECPPNFEYTPGQYVELKFLPISKREWHPFTIASAPNEGSDGLDAKELVFYIKNAGRWTGALFDYASAFDLSKVRTPPQISIRGPHGAPAMNYFRYKHILVIGSGVGATPLLSIWKYLVAKGRAMAERKKRRSQNSFMVSMHGSIMDASRKILSERSIDLEGVDDCIAFSESLELAAARAQSSVRSSCIFLLSLYESMAVSLSLFALFVLGETTTIVLQIFGFTLISNYAGCALSILALAFHGSAILVSSNAIGWSVYNKRFQCWLECSIVFVDSIALWYSLQSCLEAPNYQEESKDHALIYFTFFGYVVALQALRIFHMFYTALKSTRPSTNVERTVSMKDLDNVEDEILSVQGILINQKYANMKFAAQSLLPPIIKEGLSDVFSMNFYGTRESQTNDDEQELIASMMGDEGGKLDVRSSILFDPNNTQREDFFCAGRPDWNRVFLKAIAKAHCTNEEGESVGVFFCGSPAIAKDLQSEAKRVTAQHQFAMRQLYGKACKCKLIVHS